MISMIVWGLFVVLLSITAIGYFSRSGASVSLPGVGGVGSWVKKNQNALFLVVAWAFALYFPLTLGDKGVDGTREWWWAIVTHKVGIALIIGFTLFGWMTYHNPTKPFRYTLAKIGIWVFAIVAIWHVFGRDWKMPSSASASEAGSTVSTYVATAVGGKSPEEIRVTQFWHNSGLPRYQADVMIEHARKESGFRQFNPDGSINKNPTSSAIGVMQIMDSLHRKEAEKLELNIDTEEGNLNYALHLVKKRVASDERFNLDWDATAERPATVLAPVEGWTEVINVPPNHHINWVSSENFRVRTQDGTVKDGNESFGRIVSVQFQSSTTGPDGTPEAVEVQYFFSRILR